MTARFVPLRYFAIILVPIIIFLVNATLTDHFFPADAAVPVSILDTDNGWKEAAGRYKLLGTTWVFAAFVLLVLAMLVRDLAEPTVRQTKGAAIAGVILIVAMTIPDVVKYIINPDAGRVYDRLGADLFETALAQGTLPGCFAPDDRWLLGRCGDNPVLTMFHRIMDLVNILAGLGVGALIVGMILCLAVTDADDPDTKAAFLARSLRRMRRQLYLSGLTLSIGIFFASSWMYWPSGLIIAAETEAYDTLVTASALFTGLYFSLLILSFFLPVALILDGRVKALSAAHATQGDAVEEMKWRETRGLKGDLSDHLRAGFALVAPVLAAFAGGIPHIAL